MHLFARSRSVTGKETGERQQKGINTLGLITIANKYDNFVCKRNVFVFFSTIF
jgi:hypothetical protein